VSAAEIGEIELLSPPPLRFCNPWAPSSIADMVPFVVKASALFVTNVLRRSCARVSHVRDAVTRTKPLIQHSQE
jgi:hypothetical protein